MNEKIEMVKAFVKEHKSTIIKTSGALLGTVAGLTVVAILVKHGAGVEPVAENAVAFAEPAVEVIEGVAQ